MSAQIKLIIAIAPQEGAVGHLGAGLDQRGAVLQGARGELGPVLPAAVVEVALVEVVQGVLGLRGARAVAVPGAADVVAEAVAAR